ncbi:DNA repair protein complementing XP-A cells homolog Xpac [Lycorma delicatula]|uniref:DNA repair protein complementing XP-A cells homolog Xpac n=1 Tax=Lycorma delicatula TaxID=130591 RepID=UPI003F50E8BF
MSTLTDEQRELIERNRQKALLLRKSKNNPSDKFLKRMGGVVELVENKTICVQGNKFIDSGGGFLIKEGESEEKKRKIVEMVEPLKDPDRPTCTECQEKFAASFLFQHFEHPVCDKCRDDEEKHSLITRTDAKNEYLLKDCDLDKREPILKFILRKNPHNSHWGDMKLYLQLQIEKRALEVWGSQEELEEEIERREEKKCATKAKKYNKNMKALRMTVRSSLYDRTTKSSHEHEFGPETYNEEDDNYSRNCLTCQYSEVFEKM